MHFNILALAAPLIATVRAAAVSAPAPVPSGDPELRNCDTRYLYCGSDLMSISKNYKKQIDKALSQSGQPTDDAHEQQSLFSCIDGINGDV
ncbi:hypothetical protein CC80DRAFT_7869 [Byssothecium circinans]|uniref:Uncharacterized protein n=1 Tax=Byssothecium circinans TaxID=147558 RepID=A0A6A5UGQ3_9PLEO|nr:hypothetical protein CC80DRAFT_7869 [Byssothecium circinans]